MDRDLYPHLLAWKRSPRRKPLLLKGARQVGKTWILKAFAQREYQDSIYLNFEEDPRIGGLFEDRLSPEALLRNIGLYLGTRIEPGPRTLLIFDEVQACAGALNSLKYFFEHAPQVPVAAAGSLLGIRLGRTQSFPVGKVDMLDLRPLSFLEFLDAHGESGLRELIASKRDFTPFPEPLHARLNDLLKLYYFVGGMPEAVDCHAQERDLAAVRKIQRDILNGYQLDFAKHASPSDIPKLSLVWESIPVHLARENKKFMFSAIRRSARGREYENAIAWLSDAGLIRKAFRVSTARLPLRAYARPNIFKVYALDVGLLCAMTRLPPSVLIEGDRLFREFRGALVENYVAQQLVQGGAAALHYWASDGGRAELDFLHEQAGAVLPLEVKAGLNPRSKSLRSYDQQFGPPSLSRTNLLNLRRDGRILNYPLYAISRFPDSSLSG